MATGTTVLDSKLKAGPGTIGVAIFGVALLIGFIYAGSHLIGDLHGYASDERAAIPPAGGGASHRAGVRVCERIPRHGKRRGHRHLYALS